MNYVEFISSMESFYGIARAVLYLSVRQHYTVTVFLQFFKNLCPAFQVSVVSTQFKITQSNHIQLTAYLAKRNIDDDGR